MANANWANPTLTSTYTNFVTEVKNRDEDLALQFDGTTATAFPTNTIRWDSSANRWKKWNGTTWGELTGTYALTGLSTSGNASVGGTLGVTGATTLGTASVTGTLGVTGTTTLGNASVSGTLGVTGTTTLGNASVSGTLGVTGATTLATATATNLTVSGSATVPGLNSGQLAGNRNRVINGAMALNKRYQGSSVSCPAGSVTYTLDRWYTYCVGAALSTVRANINYNGFTTAYRITGAAGSTGFAIGHRIEAANCYDLAGKTVTLSFYAATSSSIGLGVSLSYAVTSDNWLGSRTAISFTNFSTTSSYAFYSFVIAIPSAATGGLQIEISPQTNLTSGTVDIFGVQLENGSVATPFEWRSRGVELALCQRYYYRPDMSWTHQAYGTVNTNSTVTVPLPVEMRTTPSITAAWTSLVACSAGTIAAIGQNAAQARITCTTAGDFAGVITFTSFDAEL